MLTTDIKCIFCIWNVQRWAGAVERSLQFVVYGQGRVCQRGDGRGRAATSHLFPNTRIGMCARVRVHALLHAFMNVLVCLLVCVCACLWTRPCLPMLIETVAGVYLTCFQTRGLCASDCAPYALFWLVCMLCAFWYNYTHVLIVVIVSACGMYLFVFFHTKACCAFMHMHPLLIIVCYFDLSVECFPPRRNFATTSTRQRA